MERERREESDNGERDHIGVTKPNSSVTLYTINPTCDCKREINPRERDTER